MSSASRQALDVPVAAEQEPGGGHLADFENLFAVVEVFQAGVAAEPVRADPPVEPVDQRGQRQRLSVEGDGQPVLEGDGQGVGGAGERGRPAPGVHLLGNLVEFGIVEDARLELTAPQIGVAADDPSGEQIDPGGPQFEELVLASDGIEVVGAAERTLVTQQRQRPVEAAQGVLGAVGGVEQGLRAERTGQLDRAVGDQRTAERGAHGVDAEVDGLGGDRGGHVPAGELGTPVEDVDRRAERFGHLAFVRTGLVLTDVDAHGVHLADAHPPQPQQQIRAVEPAAEQGHDGAARVQGVELREGTYERGTHGLSNLCTGHR